MDLPTLSYAPLFERADSTSSTSTATDSNGCVVCDTDSSSCPTCPSGEQCIQTVQTCSKCPEYVCKSTGTSTSSSSKTNVGGIVGGTVGGIVGLAVLLFLFYKYYYQRKVAFNRIRHKEFYFDDDAEINFHHNRMADMEKPSQRTSLATTMFTRASNIIPIAYIPGVTIDPQSRNQSSRMSTVSEAGTVSSEFIGDRYSKASIVGNPALTTTAIRAKPKLVTVVDMKTGEPAATTQDGVPSTAVGVQQLGGVRSVQVGRGKNQIALAEDLIEEEEEDDVQSVVMKEEGGTMLTTNSDYEPFIIDDNDDDAGSEAGSKELRSTRSRESNGSIILEVEMDQQSPFDDAFDNSTKDQ